MALIYRIQNFKFMHILCFNSFGRKYFVIFTEPYIITMLKNHFIFFEEDFKRIFSKQRVINI